MISAAELDRALQRLETQSTRLRAVSHRNPHQWLEDKQELSRLCATATATFQLDTSKNLAVAVGM